MPNESSAVPTEDRVGLNHLQTSPPTDPSPTERPIENGSILIHDGSILAVGPSATIKIPRNTEVIDCKGLVVTAGFWNSHVHIFTPNLLHAEKLSSEQLTSQLQEMLTRWGWGFTTVFDLASVLENTTLIRRRIESGKVKGPRILTVGEPFWAKGGTPIYVRGFLEANHISMPEVESSGQAVERVRQQIHRRRRHQDFYGFCRTGQHLDNALGFG
jgi:imidazolonepropionase-like amidohydrolase